MSREFTDLAGRTWKLSLDWFLHEQVKEREGVMLLALGDNECELLARLHTDYALLVNILWILCEEQAPALGVVDGEKLKATQIFAKGLGGDVLESAAHALVDAVIDFFPNPDQRDSLRKLTEMARATSTLMSKATLERVAALDPALLAQSYIDSVTNSQPSLALATPEQPAVLH